MVVLGCIQQDTRAPTYTNVSSNVSAAMINEVVSFTATWEDETALHSYVFSWTVGNNCTTWMNASAVKFEPEKRGVASYIAAIPEDCRGKEIRWKFYARDKAGNWNSTPEYKLTILGEVEEIFLRALEMGEKIEKISTNSSFFLEISTSEFSFSMKMNVTFNQDKKLNKRSIFITYTYPTTTTFMYYSLPSGTFMCVSGACYEVEEESLPQLSPASNLTNLTSMRKMIESKEISLKGCGVAIYINRTCDCVEFEISPTLVPELLSLWKNLTVKQLKQMMCLDRETGIALHYRTELQAISLESMEITSIVEYILSSLSLEVDPSVFELPFPTGFYSIVQPLKEILEAFPLSFI